MAWEMLSIKIPSSSSDVDPITVAKFASRTARHLPWNIMCSLLFFLCGKPQKQVPHRRTQSAAICQLADECYHKHLIAGYLPAQPIHGFPCLQWKDIQANTQGLYRQVLRNTQMVSSSPSDKTHWQFNFCQGHRMSLRTKQKQSSRRWKEVRVGSYIQRNTPNHYLLYSNMQDLSLPKEK